MSQPVKKEIAIGLKDIGFDASARDYIFQNSMVKYFSGESGETALLNYNSGKYNNDGWEIISRPTINDTVDWLIGKHGIVIVVVPYYESKGKLKWVYSVIKLNENMGEEIAGNDAEIYGEPTRTEALSAGIEVAIIYLKNLKQ
jgi:hypothetical protein